MAHEQVPPVDVDVAGRTVTITSPDKVMFPERGETKLDLARYYVAVGEPLMRTVRDRPTLLQRFPNGVTGQSFFQKRIPDAAPGLVGDDDRGHRQRHRVPGHRDGRPRPRALGGQPGVPRVPPVAVPGRHPEDTDELRIDLDPSPGVTFEMVREAAAEVRTFLDEVGIIAFPKTTGNRGLHLYARVEPGWGSLAVRQAAVSVARAMECRRPDLMTAAWWKEERGQGCSSTSTRTLRTRPSSVRGACGRASAPRSRRRSGGTSSR